LGCSIELRRKARKYLRRAPGDVVKRVMARLRELFENPVGVPSNR